MLGILARRPTYGLELAAGCRLTGSPRATARFPPRSTRWLTAAAARLDRFDARERDEIVGVDGHVGA